MAGSRKKSKDDRRDLDLSAGVFDIETEDWDTFAAGGHLDQDGVYKAWTWEGEDSFADHLLSLHGSLWAHNGGAFDAKWLIDHALRRGLPIRVVLSGSSAVKVWIGKNLVVCDSFALFKIGLKDLTKASSIHKEELGLPCRCGKKCGGFCSIRRGMPKNDLDRMLHYLEQDCRSLHDAIESFRAFGSKHDLDLCTTVGASAWRNARRLLALRKTDLVAGHFKFARRAYFGGRVQVFRPSAVSGFEVDINAAYPSAIASVPLPTGAHSKVYGEGAGSAFDRGLDGIYKARVRVPDMHIPPLPHRCRSGRIAYPTGNFQGTWAGNELRYARSLGVEVVIHEALVWDHSRVIFKPWVDKIWGLRHAAPGGKSGPLGTFLKFIANSLTGKLGSNPVHDQIEFDPPEIRDCHGGNPRNPEEPRSCKLKGSRNCGQCCEHHCNSWCGAHRPIFYDLGIYSRKVWRIEECAHPEWAAYLTADVRVRLHRQLTADGRGGVSAVYCDTDSVFSTERRTWRVSDELGDFEDKGPWSCFQALAPKVYTYERKGGKVLRAKGVSVKGVSDVGDTWARLAKGEKVGSKRQGIVGFRAGARKGEFFVAGSRVRRVKDPGFGDRFLVKQEGMTRPPTIEECDELWR